MRKTAVGGTNGMKGKFPNTSKGSDAIANLEKRFNAL